MRIFENIAEWQAFRRTIQGDIGFAPTMGALHAGHASLFTRSKAENAFTIASIFVNPTQFNNQDDLTNYPRTLEGDIQILEAAGVDYLLLPNEKTLYPDGYAYRISENIFSKILCGAHRPGHFDGVLTVVMKLLQLVAPTRAYFGEKDYQQLSLIRGMAEAFFLPTQIVPCKTLREEDGLAMSSRNRRLTPEERQKAPLLYQALQSAKPLAEIRTELEAQGFAVDYLEEHEGRIFIAATLGKVRLIDNEAVVQA